MKRAVLFTYLIAIFFNFSYAQVSDVAFIGTLAVKGGKAFSYKLLVTDSSGCLKGYSVTDLRGANETKAAVKGRMDKAKKQISFRETKIYYTKSKSAATNFCYINGVLKISKVQGAVALKGSFKGYKGDGKTICATGRIALFCAQNMLNKLLKAAHTDSVIAHKPKTDTPKAPGKVMVVYEKELSASQIKTLMPGQSMELVCPSPLLSLEIWDAKTIDGDKVMIEQDNVPILENFTLSGKRKVVKINMGKKETVTIRLLALNEGAEPLNTARLRLVCGTEEHYIDATTTMLQSIRIILKKKAPQLN